MKISILLNEMVGKKVKLYLAGGVTLKGTLQRYFVKEDFRGKFYEYAIVLKNGKRRFFPCTDVLSWEIK